MKIIRPGYRHIVERRLAAAATSAAGAQDALTAAERDHLESCQECGRLLEGHRLAERLLRSPWGPVSFTVTAGAAPRQPLHLDSSDVRRPALRPRVRPALLVELAAALAVGILISGGLLWLRGQSMGVKPMSSPSAIPSPTETALPSASPFKSAEYPLVEIPEALARPIPLPSGADISEGSEILADGDWLLTNLEFLDQPNGHRSQLHAIDLATGRFQRLADHYGEGGVSSGRATWVDLGCVYAAQEPVGGNADVCTSWKVHLTDLATGSDRVIASGKVTESVSTPMYQWGTGEFVSPRASLSPDTLAYTTGDLEHGFVMHLLPLSDGVERTIQLGGMVDAIRWTGEGFVWVENADLRSDGPSQGYYTAYYYASNRLMVLPTGSSTPIELGVGPIDLAGGNGRVLWLSAPTDPSISGDVDVWTASGPDWVPTRPIAGLAASKVAISGSWIGWHEWQMELDTFLVLRPQDSAPHLIKGCYGMSGGLIFIAKRDPGTLALTGLLAVRIADLP